MLNVALPRRPGLRRRLIAAGAVPCAIGLCLLAARTAAAQQASPPSPSDPVGAGAGEVVVTARHRTETAQSVPASVSVVSGDFLKETNTTTLNQLVGYVPSVQFADLNPRNSGINIRGLGSASGVASDGIDPGVGFYVDQVYYSRPATAAFDLMDIDQVEVLQGPQGTLFGKNTTAGVISITTAGPTFTPHADGEITAGDYSTFTAKGALSGPLVGDVLAGRLSVQTSTRDGLAVNDYTGRDVNGYRNLSLRGQLLYQPEPNLKFRLIADYSKQYLNCCYQVLSGIVTPPTGKSFTAYAEALGYTPVVDPFARRADSNTPTSARQETGGVSLEGEYSLPKAVITSITAWRFWNWWPSNDVDATPLPIFTAANLDDYENQFSQELRIASTGSNRIDYVAGLYVFHEAVTANSVQRYGDAASYFLFGPTFPAIVANGYGLNSTGVYDSTSVAAFGQATLHLTPQWSLTGGLRYTYDWKSGQFAQTVGGGAPLTGALAPLAVLRSALAIPTAYTASHDEGDPSGQVNLSYQATPDILAYATLAHGAKSAGINLTQLPAGATPLVKAETIDSAEIGLKTRLADRKVTVNLALFFEDDHDYQGTAVVTGTTRTYLANIPRVQSKGAEIDARANPNRYVSLHASVVYDDASYQSYPAAPCGLENVLKSSCDLSGWPLNGIPRWTVSTGGEVRKPFTLGTRSLEAFLAVDDAFRASEYTTGTDSIYTREPSLNLVDLRAGVRAPGGRWEVFAWGKNVTDERYFTSTGSGIGNLGALFSALGDPATWGVTLRAKI